jgi:NAD(P)-dependent dehydrogenase (short-subunit alcohol dehydrogenase family)
VMDEAELTEALTVAQRRAQAVDILINVAGGSAPGLIAELDTKTWDRLYSLNVRSTVIACRTVLPSMRRQRKGTIVNMASISGLRGDPGWAAYNSAKAAIINLTQCLAWEAAMASGPTRSAQGRSPRPGCWEDSSDRRRRAPMTGHVRSAAWEGRRKPRRQSSSWPRTTLPL